MNTTRTNQTDVAVMPLRFTDHLRPMRDFLALLGFSSRVSRDESWVDMAGESGLIALHPAATSGSGAPSGHTSLSFEVPDVGALARQLTPDFADIDIYDEAWGRVLLVRGQAGSQFDFNERFIDRYGYHVDEPHPAHGVAAMAVRYEPPSAPIRHLLAAAGFTRLDEGDDQWWRAWRAPGGGIVALHPPTDGQPHGSTRLGVRTQEPLADLADRLRAAGHKDVVVSTDFGGELTVIDPDSQSILVQSSIPAS
jgi:hypothetical protein